MISVVLLIMVQVVLFFYYLGYVVVFLSFLIIKDWFGFCEVFLDNSGIVFFGFQKWVENFFFSVSFLEDQFKRLMILNEFLEDGWIDFCL